MANIKKTPGRPAKGFGERKATHKSIRFGLDTADKLYYLKQKLNKKESEIIRIAIDKMFNEEARK